MKMLSSTRPRHVPGLLVQDTLRNYTSPPNHEYWPPASNIGPLGIICTQVGRTRADCIQVHAATCSRKCPELWHVPCRMELRTWMSCMLAAYRLNYLQMTRM